MGIPAKAHANNNLEQLFDLQESKYQEFKDFVEELVLLKNLWDGVVLVLTTRSSW
jgi:hypothetical protein